MWEVMNFLDNMPKYSYVFPAVCVQQNQYVSICKVFQIWLLISGLVGKWPVGRWPLDLIKRRKKTCLRKSFRLCILVEVYLVILILISFILTIKKQILRHTLRSETIFYNGKPFKYDEKCFLFHLKSSFRSQDI